MKQTETMCAHVCVRERESKRQNSNQPKIMTMKNAHDYNSIKRIIIQNLAREQT